MTKMVLSLFRFWKRAGYVPLYVRQTTSELTGEHTCVMVRDLNTSVESDLEWLREFVRGTFFHLHWFPLPDVCCRFPQTVPLPTFL